MWSLHILIILPFIFNSENETEVYGNVHTNTFNLLKAENTFLYIN